MEYRTFSIIAATFHGNRGAQAMLETVIGRLSEQQPGTRFHVYSYYPGEDRRLVDDPRVTIHSSTPLALVAWLLPWSLLFGLFQKLLGSRVLRFAPAAIRGLASSVALVDLAGVAFIDGREKFLPFNALTILPAWLIGTPVVKMPQATGPYRNWLNRLVARVILPMCRMVWARGPGTLAHLSNARFPGVRFAQADDIAFNFQEDWSLTSEGAGAMRRLLDRVVAVRATSRVRGIVGLCPSAVLAVQARKVGGTYESVLAALIQRLAASGFLVVLFPNATRESAGSGERNNDLPVMRRLWAECQQANDPAPLMADFDLNAAEIKRLLAAMDIVLVSRFHAMVGALSLGVPPVVLGWSHKYAEVMARFQLQDQVMDHERLGLDELHATVVRVFMERDQLRVRIREQLPAIREAADRPVTALLTPSLGADLA